METPWRQGTSWPTTTLKRYIKLYLDRTKWFVKKKNHSSLQERMETAWRRGISWPTMTLKICINLDLDHTKWFVTKKGHISSHRSQERPLASLKEKMETPWRRGTSWPTMTLKLYIKLYLDHTKWFVKRKVHISSHMSQECPSWRKEWRHHWDGELPDQLRLWNFTL